ncbi:MAG: IS110 family transposase [Solirubrobacterales bacterium]|nr:IS110 family transposase [Solirubrobacterales bacterium]
MCTRFSPSTASSTSTQTCSAKPDDSSLAPSSCAPRQRLDSLLALLEHFDREIDACAKEIDRLAKADERVKLLCQIHGVGPYTAMLIIAEIGDVRRFPTARHLCAWAGLTPTVRSSDGKARLGNISRQGSSIAMGGRRSRHARPHPRRAAAPAVRTDRQTPRPQSRPRRRRPPNPHPLLHGLRDGEIRYLKASRPGQPHQSLDDARTSESVSALDRTPGAGTRACARSGELVPISGLPN